MLLVAAFCTVKATAATAVMVVVLRKHVQAVAVVVATTTTWWLLYRAELHCHERPVAAHGAYQVCSRSLI